MSGQHLAAADSVSDAIAGLSSMEISEPNDIDGIVRAVALVLQDIPHLLFRAADRLSETAISPHITDQLWDAGGAAAGAADDTSELVHFSLVAR